MSETIDRSELHVLNPAGDFILKTHIEQDVSEIKKDNWEAAQRSNNGFTDGRSMRKTASLPMVEYLNALKLGYQLDSEDPPTLSSELKRYLADIGRGRGYQTVKSILNAHRNANIIVK